jgi:hypothetical protein
MELNKKEILEVDKLFKLLYEKKSDSLDDSFIEEKTSITRNKIIYYKKFICETSDKRALDLVICEVAPSGDYFIVRFNKIETDKFIEDGGFVKLWKKNRISSLKKKYKESPWSVLGDILQFILNIFH